MAEDQPIIDQDEQGQYWSDDVVIAKIKADAAKMRTNICEKNAAWKGYDCGCFEKIEVEKNIEISKIIPYGVQNPGLLSSDSTKALKDINRTYNQRLTQECTKSAYLSQNEIDKEGQEVFKKCEANPDLNNHFKCSCLAESFGEARKEKGRDAGQGMIISELSYKKDCINIKKKVKNSKSSCLSGKIFFDLKGVKLGDYCECVSNEFETLLSTHTGSFSYPHEDRLEAKAKAQCKKSLIH